MKENKHKQRISASIAAGNLDDLTSSKSHFLMEAHDKVKDFTSISQVKIKKTKGQF